MYIPDIIKKKRDGHSLTRQDIEYIIEGYVGGSIPDYQAAAFIMACFISGLNTEETFHLTSTMMNSGDVYDFSDIDGIKVDKHSTGGVGDKVSIPLAPVLASLGFKVPMVSGRGLGHTGGTLDKLESIEGFDVNVPAAAFKKQLKNIGVVMAGQTKRFVPADKKLYALRDVTGTVESIPLITASIMSKKMAEGIDSLLLDVKQGNGAFMKTEKDAANLGQSMFDIGMHFKKKIIYAVTDMSEVLGDTAGNGVEILESMDILKGERKNAVYELVKEFAVMLLLKNSMADNRQSAEEKFDSIIDKGYAYEKFLQMTAAQKGNVKALSKEALQSSKRIDVKAKSSGYLKAMDTYKIGVSLIYLKAGRFTKEDSIDHRTGIYVHKHTGDKVSRGDALFTICHSGEYKRTAKMLEESVIIGDRMAKPVKLIKTVKGYK